MTLIKPSKCQPKSAVFAVLASLWLFGQLTLVQPALADPVPTSNLSLKFRVYVFAMPTWFDGTVDVTFDEAQVLMNSVIDNFIISNWHRSELTFSQCNYRPIRYHNRGFSPGWKFDDTVEYHWDDGLARYRGELQRPNQTVPTAQELEHELSTDVSQGRYVDKLSQFFVMGCHFADESQQSPLLLTYLDDTIGRYRVRLVERGKQLRVAGKLYQTIEVQSEPFEATPGSIHRRVNYWLVPELGYLPALIKTKLGRLPLKVRLTDVELSKE